jgi:cell division protein FtsW
MARRRQQSVEERILLTAVMCLFAAGAVMVFSASSARTVLQGGGNGTSFLVKYVVYGAAGFVVLHLVSRHALGALPRLTGPFLGLALVLCLLVKVPGVGVEVNGAQRWLGAGPLQFQPAELLKLALVLYAVKLFAERPRRAQRPKELAPLALVAGASLFVVGILQSDLGTALVMAFACCAIMIAAGVQLRVLGWVAAGGGVLVLLLAAVEPYRMARLTTFLDPWAHAADNGFQSVQGQIALGSGGLLGQGLGQSQAKNLFLPEAHTDFILAIVGEELGVVGILVLLLLYGMLAYAGLRIAKSAVGLYAKLLAAGITCLVIAQAMLNIFVVLGLAPLTGVPLPFISYGSTNLVVLLMGMGILLNVARGGTAHLRVVPGSVADGSEDRDRRRRDGRARGAGAGGGRRAAG